MSRKTRTLSIASLFAIAVLAAHAADTPSSSIKLTPDLLNLLRAEMREIAGGIQGIAGALATGDWKTIETTSAKIRASYIMEKQLTPAQAQALERALPEPFKQLDAEFHQRAEKLGQAAAAHDAELATFHYSRLVESCVRCHATYAPKRFPGFQQTPTRSH